LRSNHALILFLLFILLILGPVTFLKEHFSRPKGIAVTLYSRVEGKIYRLGLEEYLVGAVAAEMPARFSLEALKAQAVAARTITIRRMLRFGGKGCSHCRGADLCDDPDECQAWLSGGNLRKRWGEREFPGLYRKIRQAVRETAGIIMTYQNRPIDAVFHSTCGVGTADAGEVWHNNVPYLRSVSCNYDHHSPRYRNQAVFTWGELGKRLHLPENSLTQIKIKTVTSRGRVLLLTMGRYGITGNEFRRVLHLTSNCFTWRKFNNGLVFTSIGYGHGVGMCQYGADGMAKAGWGYQRILEHYYQGVRLVRLK
jgi:stage II sporulation protein D